MATPMPFPATAPAPVREAIDQEALDRAVIEWWEATQAIERWVEIKDAAAAVILAKLAPGQSYAGLSVARGRRQFSSELAAKALNPAEFASICEFRPSPKLAKEYLDPDVLDGLYVDVGAPFLRRDR